MVHGRSWKSVVTWTSMHDIGLTMAPLDNPPFQGVGIEGFHCIQRCPHFRGAGMCIQRCSHLRELK